MEHRHWTTSSKIFQTLIVPVSITQLARTIHCYIYAYVYRGLGFEPRTTTHSPYQQEKACCPFRKVKSCSFHKTKFTWKLRGSRHILQMKRSQSLKQNAPLSSQHNIKSSLILYTGHSRAGHSLRIPKEEIIFIKKSNISISDALIT